MRKEVIGNAILPCVCGRSPYIFQRADQKWWSIGCPICRIKTDRKRSRNQAANAWNSGHYWLRHRRAFPNAVVIAALARLGNP